jgi:hypothetical protein
MSYAPFDGVLLDDLRPPVPGALSAILHLQVAERLGGLSGRDALEARGGACSELMAHGLLPDAMRGLSRHGLDLGSPRSQHSLSSLANHLELYLEAVSSAGYIEPNAALWDAVGKELDGRRGLWVERAPRDGPLDATLKDLQPARLRALACLPRLGGATFRLATHRGGGGLFGSGQPLADWFLDGLEAHGQAFAADIQLAEPDGWGGAPWSGALDALFEGRLDLGPHRSCFRRGLVDGPWHLALCAVEQTMEWVNGGIDPKDITIIHPAPEEVREFIEAPLRAQGVRLSPKSPMRPLIQSGAWSPFWSLLDGLSRLDPFAAAIGLHTSRRPEIRAWADILARLDSSGREPFDASLGYLSEPHRSKAEGAWRQLQGARKGRSSPAEWGEALNGLVAALQLPAGPDDFYAPLGLLRDAWGRIERMERAWPRGAGAKDVWGFDRMLASLRLFLESARAGIAPDAPDATDAPDAPDAPNAPRAQNAQNGVGLVPPSALLDDWDGAEATLILDLSEGSWPARPMPNPDLGWACRADINAALLKATENYEGPFPPALQRFWLPRAEHAGQMPRAFQREAYAFNKALAMTRRHVAALSPSQDGSGRNVAQGAFWTALEGAGPWAPRADACASGLRWAWEGFHRLEQADGRSKAAQVLGVEAPIVSGAPIADRIPDLWRELLGQRPDDDSAPQAGGDSAPQAGGRPGHASPTLLESLARCPFRTVAERVWRLDQGDDAGDVQRAVGTMAHRILQAVFAPLVGIPDWPTALLSRCNLEYAEIITLENMLGALWLENGDGWLKSEARLNPEQVGQAKQQVGALLPNMAAYLKNDLEATCPAIPELALLFPDKVEVATRSNSKHPLREGWSRTITGVEQRLGPMELPMANTRAMPIAGIVDRLEQWENAGDDVSFLRVIDYKTSTSHSLNAFGAEDAPFGTHLQTPLYVWMAMEIFGCGATSVLIPLRDPSPRPFAAHLNHLRPPAEAGLGGDPWQSRLARTLERMGARIEQGDYPPTPGEHCRHCGYAALCMRPVDVAAVDQEDENGD